MLGASSADGIVLLLVEKGLQNLMVDSSAFPWIVDRKIMPKLVASQRSQHAEKVYDAIAEFDHACPPLESDGAWLLYVDNVAVLTTSERESKDILGTHMAAMAEAGVIADLDPLVRLI